MRSLLCACAVLTAALIFCLSAGRTFAAQETFADAGARAASTLTNVFYAGAGLWRDCSVQSCKARNSDWGADSATYALYLRWLTTGDANAAATLAQLAQTAPQYPAPCSGTACPAWSDTPSWDAVALLREYHATGDRAALSKAKSAIAYVEGSRSFWSGACPEIPYQMPRSGGNAIKSLETDGNLIKASLLVYDETNDPAYLRDAKLRYAAARTHYLDPAVPLYTNHVLDDGASCTQVYRRFFASVNGNMIWNGVHLWRITGERHYFNEALATANTAAANLSDSAGVFADVQGENDVAEPLVEAMYDLAVNEHQAFARAWIMRNAAAALSSRGADGTFPRFFDGPPQQTASLWESNGGIALEIAAAALAPQTAVPPENSWQDGTSVGATVTTLPATIAFTGSAIALVGTISEMCQSAHVRVFIDGVETFDRTGLWQNPSMPDGNSVFFAWRWPQPGAHTIRLEPGDPAQTGLDVLHLDSVLGSGENR